MRGDARPVRVGLLGCGTVGGGVLRLLRQSGASLAQRVGAPLEVGRVLVRDAGRARAPELDPRVVTTDAEVLLGDPSLDVIVEVMGGVEPARAYVARALESGRSVVTANKALLAAHGEALLGLAVSRGVDLAFEGSVGGGIPVVRTLREALASDRVIRVEGIVNGTCNYVLSRMRDEGLGFDAALAEAQAAGYAEADPTLDVDGHDAAHKLAVLAMLAFGARVDPAELFVEGIRGVAAADHAFARRFGFAIKHLALGRDHGDRVELRVHPALVRIETPLANVRGVLNAVAIEGEALGPCLLSGRGAGAMPTAVSVVADLLDVARARRSGFAGAATRAVRLERRPMVPMGDVRSRCYLRFVVVDRPGVLARLAGALGDAGVSIEQMVQQGGGGGSGQPVDIVMLTHEAAERDLQRALGAIAQGGLAAAPATVLRVVD